MERDDTGRGVGDIGAAERLKYGGMLRRLLHLHQTSARVYTSCFGRFRVGVFARSSSPILTLMFFSFEATLALYPECS